MSVRCQAPLEICENRTEPRLQVSAHEQELGEIQPSRSLHLTYQVE